MGFLWSLWSATVVKFQNQAGVLPTSPVKKKHRDLPIPEWIKTCTITDHDIVIILHAQWARHYAERFKTRTPTLPKMSKVTILTLVYSWENLILKEAESY